MPTSQVQSFLKTIVQVHCQEIYCKCEYNNLQWNYLLRCLSGHVSDFSREETSSAKITVSLSYCHWGFAIRQVGKHLQLRDNTSEGVQQIEVSIVPGHQWLIVATDFRTFCFTCSLNSPFFHSPNFLSQRNSAGILYANISCSSGIKF